jgi:hypothetical protein
MTLAVVGAGFGRTGTLSMKAALEQLGLGPCYHMAEVVSHPHFAEYWMTAASGQPVKWDVVFQGYRSAVDWPACAFYREQAEHWSTWLWKRALTCLNLVLSGLCGIAR